MSRDLNVGLNTTCMEKMKKKIRENLDCWQVVEQVNFSKCALESCFLFWECGLRWEEEDKTLHGETGNYHED